jgi:hypothetical protein
MRIFLSLILTFCFFAVSVGMPLSSQAVERLGGFEGQGVSSDSSSAAVSLENAIIIVKEKMPIPEGLEEFSSDYQEAGGYGSWNLKWRNIKDNAEFSVSVDSESGEIKNISYYRNSFENVYYKGLPSFTKAQCLEIAKKTLIDFLPDRFSKTRLNNDDQQYQEAVLRARDYPIIYNFNFVKTVNGIAVADQGINIGINAETGEMVRLDSIWNYVEKLPNSSGMLKTNEAEDIFKDKSGYELTYYTLPNDNPDISGEIRLVYRFKHPGRFAINALDGKIINQNIYYRSEDASISGGIRNSANEKVALTPEEIKAVEETKTFIASDQAGIIAERAVRIPREYKIISRNLERYYGIPGGRVWNIQFANSKDSTIWASVNARTGQLLSFYKNYQLNPSSGSKKEISQDDAQKIAESFIERLQPTKTNQIILRQSYPSVILQTKIIPYPSDNYNFQYSRIVNGIVYPENGFNVGVNAFSGEVMNYNFTWLDAKFPEPSDIIGLSEVNEKYLAEFPLKLEYIKEYVPYGDIEQIKYILQYHSQGGEGMLFDAVNGLQIDYMGNEVKKRNKDYFNDIKNHPAAEDIRLLAEEGIVVGTGGEYRPDDQATVAEALAMLDKAYGNRYYFPLAKGKDPWYKQIIENAKRKGILDKDFSVDPEAGVKRIELARMGANADGWGDLTRVSEIFRLDFSDAKNISYDNRGYAAAMIGLKLMSLENGHFNPQGGITRGELATFLVELLK